MKTASAQPAPAERHTSASRVDSRQSSATPRLTSPCGPDTITAVYKSEAAGDSFKEAQIVITANIASVPLTPVSSRLAPSYTQLPELGSFSLPFFCFTDYVLTANHSQIQSFSLFTLAVFIVASTIITTKILSFYRLSYIPPDHIGLPKVGK